MRADLTQLFNELEDCTRLVQKILLGRGDPSDLTAISISGNIWNSIKRRFELEKQMERQERGFVDEEEWAILETLTKKIYNLGGLASHIEAALSRSGSASRLVSDEEQIEQEEAYAFPAISNAKSFVSNFTWTIRPE